MTSLPAIIAAALVGLTAFAQAPANRTQVAGTITSVDADGNKLTLKSDKGEDVTVTTTVRTLFLKMPPGETDTKKGTKIAIGGVTSGDRAVVVAPQSTDPKSLAASAVLVMSKSDVASMQQKDVDDWKKRGTTGNVTAIDAGSQSVTIKAGSRTFTVKPSEKTTFFRYAPDSARFADAKPATFADIKTGDQVRVLGNKTEDGATIQAEKVVSGTFRQIAATIQAVDPAKGEITVKDLANKNSKDLITIKLDSDTTMKKLPDTMAAMLARRYAPGAQQAAGAPGGGGGGRGMGGGGGGDVGQMLDQLPPLPITELKKGDAVMVSTTQGSDATHATGIMLLAGVEPLLTASPTATRDIMSGWNLGGGGGEGQ
jgi:transcription antitermination factor NusG